MGSTPSLLLRTAAQCRTVLHTDTKGCMQPHTANIAVYCYKDFYTAVHCYIFICTVTYCYIRVTSLHRWNKEGINHNYSTGNRFHVTLRIVSPYIYEQC